MHPLAKYLINNMFVFLFVLFSLPLGVMDAVLLQYPTMLLNVDMIHLSSLWYDYSVHIYPELLMNICFVSSSIWLFEH